MLNKHPFTSADGSRGCVFFFSIVSILALLLMTILWMRMWWTIENGHYDSKVLMRNVAQILMMLATGWFVFAGIALLQYITLAVWLYNMNRNLPALGYRPNMTPLLAALVMFLPFLNFVLTPYAMLEIWWGSDPGRLPQPKVKKSPPNSIWLWSLLTPAFSVLGVVAGRVLPDPKNMHAFSNGAIWGLIYFAVAIVSNIVLMLLVREIAAMQLARYEQLHLSKPEPDAVDDVSSSYSPPMQGEPMPPF